MAQFDPRGLRERVEDLEGNFKKLETGQSEIRVQLRDLGKKIDEIQTHSESLRLAQIERDLRDIRETQFAVLETQITIVKTEQKILDKIEPAASHEVVAILLTCVITDPIKFLGMGVKKMQMKTNQQAVASLSGRDAEGNVAAVNFDAAPSWTSDTPDVVTVTPSPDGLSCVIGSPNPGAPGSAVVTLDAAVGGKPLQATLAVDIIPGDAVAISIETEAPTDV